MKKSLLVPVLLCAGLALPSAAFGQATRTWVSGVGDDANPCSRTAPCKTFAGAISKTATSGEIDALDPGGYGAVTITKSMTIDGGGTLASILNSGTSALIVNIPADAPRRTVTLRNLTLNGAASSNSKGVNITAIGAANIRLENLRIFGNAGCGVCVSTTGAPGTRVTIDNSVIHDNAAEGVLINPATTIGMNENRVTITNSKIFGNTGAGVRVATATATKAFVFNSQISDNGAAGLLADGASAKFRVSNNDITGNGFGFQTLNSGEILSFGNNRIRGNTVDGVPTTTTAQL